MSNADNSCVEYFIPNKWVISTCSAYQISYVFRYSFWFLGDSGPLHIGSNAWLLLLFVYLSLFIYHTEQK